MATMFIGSPGLTHTIQLQQIQEYTLTLEEGIKIFLSVGLEGSSLAPIIRIHEEE